MVRLILSFAVLGLVTAVATPAVADGHEDGEQADVAAPIDPTKSKMEGEAAAEAGEAAEAAEAATDEAKTEEVPAAPKPE